MIRPEPPDSSTKPVSPDPQHLSAPMRAGRARIVRFLIAQGAAQGLFWSLPILGSLWLTCELLLGPSQFPLIEISGVTLGICVSLGALFRWRRFSPSWPKIWDDCFAGTGLVETIHFLEGHPPPTPLSEGDPWHTSLRSQASSLQLPSKAELLSVIPSNFGFPPILSLILLLLWFSVLSAQVEDSHSTDDSSGSLASGTPITPEASPSEVEPLTNSTTGSNEVANLMRENSEEQNRGNDLSETNDPSDLNLGNPASIPTSTGQRAIDSEKTQIEPLTDPENRLSSSTGLGQDPGSLPGSTLRQPGLAAESEFRDPKIGSGGLDNIAPEQTVPAQRATTESSLIRSLSGTGQGAWRDRPEEAAQISEDSPAFPVLPQPRTGPLQLPPRWQKLLNRYMKLRDNSDMRWLEKEGRR